MSTQHTPGPWVSEFEGDPVLVGTPGGRFVAMTLGCDDSVATAEDYANAALIAAAPDLLAVMGAALGTLQACLPHLKGNQEAMVKVQILACSTTIAKAEGRS